jgi:hypothetical protein
MKKAFRNMTLILAFALIAALGLLAYIRLAPVVVADWHTPILSTFAELEMRDGGSCADGVFDSARGGAGAACSLSGTPKDILARLDAIALATPRTRRLSGSAEEGLITWETRSQIWGFPDYTTAQAENRGSTTRLDLYARQRFGKADFGVNAARLKTWLRNF